MKEKRSNNGRSNQINGLALEFEFTEEQKQKNRSKNYYWIIIAYTLDKENEVKKSTATQIMNKRPEELRYNNKDVPFVKDGKEL